MMLRVVVDTNIWIRVLLGGPLSSPVLTALLEHRFQLVTSEQLITELSEVAQRPRLQKRITPLDLHELLELLEWYGEPVVLKTIPPRCRDPKDHPVLATAIDGKADGIVSGDDDLRADDELRNAMDEYGISLWGINSFLNAVEKQ
jgi:putative PIN family toxin of toxin-antitoxin system